jgi:hypothetical protein
LVRNSPEGSHHQCHKGKHGRGLQSGFPHIRSNEDFFGMDMPPMPDFDLDSHSNFVFNANVNGQEFHLDLEDPDFGDIDGFMKQMVNHGPPNMPPPPPLPMMAPPQE